MTKIHAPTSSNPDRSLSPSSSWCSQRSNPKYTGYVVWNRRRNIRPGRQPDKRHHIHRDWWATHPKSIWIRQDALAAVVEEFFATRVLGPHRRELLDADLSASADRSDRD
ncbi:hypothetical protein EV192_106872 [Actinocrispum wychmicini]|uniref:Recombinase domain-containing protein n=2 Tax=Actinocrispum wychmicini TaxID=1213861 RepID=A0A4R2JEH7_9PSEU|nr:hypothetical protein EV192_106872 [Actinocrispum wychmicini]